MIDLFNKFEQMALDVAENPLDQSQAHSEELRLGSTSFANIRELTQSI
jgi:hypothetical protein